jgi:hypothetical protein
VKDATSCDARQSQQGTPVRELASTREGLIVHRHASFHSPAAREVGEPHVGGMLTPSCEEDKLALDRIKKERQRLVLCRLMVDIMRTVHGAYAPVDEPFGTRIETLFIALCVAIGDMDGKPFSVAKIAAYMRAPRTTVIRRLDQLRSWGVIDRCGRHYYLHERALNSLIGMKSYQQVRRILGEATKELSVLDTLPNAEAGLPQSGHLKSSII